MRNYCTLFDSGYLAKGLAMYHSLARHSSEPFMLYVLPMDDAARFELEALRLQGVIIVEDREVFIGCQELEEQRLSRTVAEFCWTCASNLCDFLLRFGGIDEITYLDADLFFFSDPAPVFDEIGNRPIAITPHRLIPSKAHLVVNGIFNVGWVTFRGSHGKRCASEWAAQCREWCFNRIEDGKFGDQKYLDAWPERYRGQVCELGIGVNVAPWNVGQWKLTDGPCVDGVKIVCYHLHELLARKDGTFLLTNYDMRPEDIRLIYDPYITAYKESNARIELVAMKLQAERA